MFGGTGDLRNCSVVFTGDDAFDTDEGYQGKGQFLFVHRALDSDKAHEMDSKTNSDLDSQLKKLKKLGLLDLELWVVE